MRKLYTASQNVNYESAYFLGQIILNILIKPNTFINRKNLTTTSRERVFFSEDRVHVSTVMLHKINEVFTPFPKAILTYQYRTSDHEADN